MTRRAFTLLEMVLVMLVVAIAAALALPMVRDSAAQKLRGAAAMLVADLEYAQTHSITHSDAPRGLVFEADGTAYHVTANTDPATPVANPVGGQPYTTRFGRGRAAHLAGVTVRSVSFSDDRRLAYGAYGQLDQPGAASITLACDGRSLTVTVDAVTGQATIGQIQ